MELEREVESPQSHVLVSTAAHSVDATNVGVLFETGPICEEFGLTLKIINSNNNIIIIFK